MPKNKKNLVYRIISTFIAVILAFGMCTTVVTSGEELTLREAQDVSDVLNATMTRLADTVNKPTFGTVAGEWTVLCLARGGFYAKDDAYFTDYYGRIVEYVNQKAAALNLNGALHKSKSTDNSRVILALSSIGKDATAVGNWNLITPYEDFKWIKKQGINGAIFTLIALDTANYQTADTTIRQQCVDFILGRQLEDGGWALSGKTADPDITAMALQSLHPYKAQEKVSVAAESGFACLSSIQKDDGGYASMGAINSESSAQVIVATTTWGINPDTDERFIKNNKSVVDAILEYYIEEESAFRHVLMGDANGMATDQVCYALVAYDRFLKGKASLYDMSDVTFEDDTNISNGENTQEKENNADKENVDSDIGENPNNQTSTTVKPQDPPTDKTDGSVIPQTGEKNNLIFYVAIMTASAIGTILFLQKLKTGEN